MTPQQTTSNLLMVRPASFMFNSETAGSNAFQVNDTSLSSDEIQAKAVIEFDNFVQLLRENDIAVLVSEDTKDPIKNDAIFPNNWNTTHDDGTLVLFPMSSPSRKFERSALLLEELEKIFDVKKTVHLEHYEDSGQFLEGTGSMVLDRVHKICYACFSNRTNPVILKEWCNIMQYKPICFNAVDGNGQPIYHTNVLMALGETFVIICLDTISDKQELSDILQHFEGTQKEVISISIAQMLKFAGNMLQVKNKDQQKFLVMSNQAFESLNPDQVEQIERHSSILHPDIKTIETYGGGSARCMMAEIFLTKK